jgi:hypothetical protein
LRRIDAETSPLPKEEKDVPTRAIDIDLYDDTEDKAQIEAEIDIEKHGVPVIDVERPPVSKVKTDTTPYKKVEVTRKEKKSDRKQPDNAKLTLEEDREMKAYAEELKVPRRKGLLRRLRKKIYDFYCKIQRFALNRQRKKYAKVSEHYHDEHILSEDVKVVSLKIADEKSKESLGRPRGFQREEDETPKTINMIRNKKTGVVVATPNISGYKRDLKDDGKNIDDYEVVESQIKG